MSLMIFARGLVFAGGGRQMRKVGRSVAMLIVRAALVMSVARAVGSVEGVMSLAPIDMAMKSALVICWDEKIF